MCTKKKSHTAVYICYLIENHPCMGRIQYRNAALGSKIKKLVYVCWDMNELKSHLCPDITNVKRKNKPETWG